MLARNSRRLLSLCGKLLVTALILTAATAAGSWIVSDWKSIVGGEGLEFLVLSVLLGGTLLFIFGLIYLLIVSAYVQALHEFKAARLPRP